MMDVFTASSFLTALSRALRIIGLTIGDVAVILTKLIAAKLPRMPTRLARVSDRCSRLLPGLIYDRIETEHASDDVLEAKSHV